MERRLDELHEVRGLQVFHHLNRDETAERAIGLCRDECQCVGSIGYQPPIAARLDHGVVHVDTARIDPPFAE